MAANNFDQCLKVLLHNEGGWSDNIHDPGKQTNFGITQAVYSAFLAQNKIPYISVKFITQAQVAAIYRLQYWNPLRCDDLPAGVDLEVLDLGVNSGVVTGAKYLQRALGFTGKQVDGHIGVLTLSRLNGTSNVKTYDAKTVINTYCDLRLSFLHKLRNWKWFGKGWNSRVAYTRQQGLAMAA